MDVSVILVGNQKETPPSASHRETRGSAEVDGSPSQNQDKHPISTSGSLQNACPGIRMELPQDNQVSVSSELASPYSDSVSLSVATDMPHLEGSETMSREADICVQGEIVTMTGTVPITWNNSLNSGCDYEDNVVSKVNPDMTMESALLKSQSDSSVQKDKESNANISGLILDKCVNSNTGGSSVGTEGEGKNGSQDEHAVTGNNFAEGDIMSQGNLRNQSQNTVSDKVLHTNSGCLDDKFEHGIRGSSTDDSLRCKTSSSEETVLNQSDSCFSDIQQSAMICNDVVKDCPVENIHADEMESPSQKSTCCGMVPTDSQSCSCEKNIQMKEETVDPGKSEKEYRTGTVVLYSDNDDDTSSTMFSSSDGGVSDGHISEEDVVELLNKRKKVIRKIISRTEGEVLPEELSPLEYLTISPDEGVELEPIGTVSGIVNVLVVVKGKLNSPALYDDTVLFLEGRQPLGLVFETFGTVEKPYYSIRFNSNKDIEERNIAVGDQVLFAPRADNLTKYVFVAELRKMKCDDASWEYDNEPPPSHVEYSDDEQERKAKQRHRKKDRGDERRAGPVMQRKKRRKRTVDHKPDSQGPSLLPGDLMKNPFGNKNQTFNHSPAHWPRKELNKNQGSGQPLSTVPVYPHRQQAPNSFQMPWLALPSFGENPNWKNQPGLGQNPALCSPNMGNFGNFMAGSGRFGPPVPRFSGHSFSTVPPPPLLAQFASTYQPNTQNFSIPPPVGGFRGSSTHQQPLFPHQSFAPPPSPQYPAQPPHATNSIFPPPPPSS